MSEENEFAKRVWDDIPVLKLGALIVWFLFMNIGIHNVFPELEPVYIMVFTEIVFSLCVYESAMSPIKRHFFMKKGNGFSYGQITVGSFTALVIFGLTVLGVLLMRAFGVTLDGNTVQATYDWSPKGVTSILLIVLVAPVYEEILFKYVIQHCVFRNTVGWIQILATGILFGFSHGTTYHAVFGICRRTRFSDLYLDSYFLQHNGDVPRDDSSCGRIIWYRYDSITADLYESSQTSEARK